MRVSSRIDGSICGAILSLHRPSLSLFSSSNRSAAAASFSAGSTHNSLSEGPRRSAHRRYTVCSVRRRPLLALPSLRFSTDTRSRRSPGPSIPPTRENHTAAAAEEDLEPEFDGDDTVQNSAPRKPRRLRSFTKKELLALVDDYDGEEIGPVDEYLEYLRDPYMRGYAQPDTQRITFARTIEDVAYPSLEQVIRAGEEEQQTLWELRFAVLTRLRSPHKVDLDHIYEIYQRLPEPRMLYIHARFRHQLLRVFGQPDERDSGSMLRYFALIADVKNTGIPLTTSEWNCAINFATRYVGTVTETEVEAALKLWREMECDAGIKATNVTFNILFDVACKAGNFTLAEMIYREMEGRGHHYNRYHYTSLIHFFGLKHETSGMRAAYKEMVNAGEMIDTVVLNAMISGLLRSGEEAPAERLYERMKAASLDSAGDADSTDGGPGVPVRTPTSDRAITQALLMFAKIGRRHPPSRPALQRMAPLAPDLQTYRILVNHYGVKRGDLAKTAAYIDEMKFFKIPLHHAIFLALFKGFAHHGGYPRSPWSERRLTGIWNALLDALDAGAAGLEVKKWLAMWALRAFARCSTRARVLDVYEALKARWSLSQADEQFMVDFLGSLVNKRK
ncbi:760b23b5-c823-418e-9569-6634540f5c69 [Thermothielavioides terrestris]|uniref:760b23b5-c823-418e-9569-6634540f5c69 n=1 Tax=Thermothielavioides terrestris TaxID=2587410 RepID=A0A446BD74_9PEZI|nr:760b23b5-c823-418e-9569-6634540f5c69 [Thermothielavioides terrestris]